jgi:hypothetical protein
VYASANLLAGPVAVSLEGKDYGAYRGVANEGPSLVREHGFALLNRSTHVQQLGERGFQLEASSRLGGWGAMTGNLTRLDGRIGPAGAPRAVRFEERFGELHVTREPQATWEVTLFLQQGKDLWDAIRDRTVAGGSAMAELGRGWSASATVQQLQATRASLFSAALPVSFVDRYASATVARAGWGSLSFAWTRTDDPNDEDPGDTDLSHVEPNTFLAGIASAHLGDRSTATLFVGERRSGVACTAGVCYLVQAFKGAELRLTSRF